MPGTVHTAENGPDETVLMGPMFWSEGKVMNEVKSVCIQVAISAGRGREGRGWQSVLNRGLEGLSEKVP